MRLALLLSTAVVTASCFQPWQLTGLYACGGGCPEGLTCDDGVCCDETGEPACPTLVPKSGRCADGAMPKTYYQDSDGDSFGSNVVTRLACSRPLSTGTWVDNSNDCDDTSAAAKPGGVEVCDGRDNDCNGTIDEGQTSLQTYYRDVDGDGFGVMTDTLMACQCPNNSCVPPGYAAVAGDCGAMNNAVHPGATELCNGVDDDCNQQTDDNVTVGVGTACSDAGIGLCAAGTTACMGGALVCRSAYTPKSDLCDGQDNDCDNQVDERPDCGGPEFLLMAGNALTGARDTGSRLAALTTPMSCLKDTGVGEGWVATLGPWSGSTDTFHLWYAEAPANTTWDLSQPGKRMHVQFSATLFNYAPSRPWNEFNQPFMLVCNADPARFSRYRPLTQLLNDGGTVLVNTDVLFSGDGGWLLARGGADLTAVKRIELVVQPGNNTPQPGFNITFDPSVGFKP